MNASETIESSVVTASYKWTRDEFVEAQLSYARQKTRPIVKKFLYGAFFLVWGFVVWSLGEGSSYTTGILLLEALAMTFIVFGRYFAWAWIFKRKWKTTQHRESDMTFHFAPAAIDMQTSFGNATVTWNAFIKIQEMERGFLLFQQTRMFHWVPFHAFESPADVEQMRKLIIQSEVPSTLIVSK